MKIFPVILLALALGLGCRSTPAPNRLLVEYSKKGMRGSWFGFAQADVYLYRLHLDGENSGIGGFASGVSGRNGTFGITDWTLISPNALRMSLKGDMDLLRLEGRLITATMFVGHIYGKSGWSNEVTFYKEEPFSWRMSKLRDSMRVVRGEGRQQ